jgi:hypothetical protein
LAEPAATDWAYAAGFVDGEGCIAITRSFVTARNKYAYSVAVVVSNNERVVLDWMRDLWQGCVVAASGSGGNSRQGWAWRISGTRCETFLRGILPLLRIKGRQCDNALAMIEVIKRSRYTLGRKFMPPEWLELQEKHYWAQRELNHRGSRTYEALPMHSPRQIKRERGLWTVEQSLS